MSTKKFTLLHSNDMHGDFFAEVTQDKEMIGGLALLAGYLNKVREEEQNVIYVIAGDMLQGNIIDTEYKGVSTIEIMNYLSPDVVALGNHEIDYGLQHLLFLEKFANFPIVNANIYIKGLNKRLMRPYLILKKDGFDFLFTGIITEKIMDTLAADPLVGSFITLEEATSEVGKITNAYKNDDIDLTVLLTHIGYESDVEFAKMIKPEWGVDMIIGGHSHTAMEKPDKVNGILIAQTGGGTNQIGRFDIQIDDNTNMITEFKWATIPITSDVCEPDRDLEKFISSYKSNVDRKYSTILTRLSHQHTHPTREIETDTGNLFADAFAECAESDVMLVGSGSIRTKTFGQVVTLMSIMETFPYNDSLTRVNVTGAQLEAIFNWIMRNENRDGEGECYQVNEGVQAIHSDKDNKLISLTIKGNKVDPDKLYRICMQGYHFTNCSEYLNISEEEMLKNGPSKVVSTSAREVLEEYLRTNHNIGRKVEGRLVFQK